MKANQHETPRIRLNPEAYKILRQRVLERDGWHCQYCGRGEHLEIHHLRSRAQMGADNQSNLITLCVLCHRRVHLGRDRE